MSTSEEQWLPVVGYEGLYEVSNQGRVRSALQRSSFPSQERCHAGHRRVWLRSGDVGRKHFVHVLVLTAFDQPRPDPTAQCRHLDGNSANNHLSNLKWGTVSENALDRVLHGADKDARKTHCPRGHEYTEANIYWQPQPGRKPSRTCRACRSMFGTSRRTAA